MKFDPFTPADLDSPKGRVLMRAIKHAVSLYIRDELTDLQFMNGLYRELTDFDSFDEYDFTALSDSSEDTEQ